MQQWDPKKKEHKAKVYEIWLSAARESRGKPKSQNPQAPKYRTAA